MQPVVKGMVQVLGTTYRIVRLETRRYEVVRIRDDLTVGAFQNGPRLEVEARSIEPELMREIARVAIQKGKTSWVGPLAL
jgi:hypothetical protein